MADRSKKTETHAQATKAQRAEEGKKAMSDYEAKLAALGYTLDPVELFTGRFMRAVRTGHLIYTAGIEYSF